LGAESQIELHVDELIITKGPTVSTGVAFSLKPGPVMPSKAVLINQKKEQKGKSPAKFDVELKIDLPEIKQGKVSGLLAKKWIGPMRCPEEVTKASIEKVRSDSPPPTRKIKGKVIEGSPAKHNRVQETKLLLQEVSQLPTKRGCDTGLIAGFISKKSPIQDAKKQAGKFSPKKFRREIPPARIIQTIIDPPVSPLKVLTRAGSTPTRPDINI
jgi:hypothetical protein